MSPPLVFHVEQRSLVTPATSRVPRETSQEPTRWAYPVPCSDAIAPDLPKVAIVNLLGIPVDISAVPKILRRMTGFSSTLREPPSWLIDELRSLAVRGLLRHSTEVMGREPGMIHLQAASLVDFTSNDYLGLSHHPVCREAACRAVTDQGCGTASSRLVTGHSALQARLEAAVACWHGEPSSVLFPSGYQANVGVVSALLGPGDLVFSDAHNHASLVDGCRLSGATKRIYPHLDAQALEDALREAPVDRRKLVITDSLFSMDGEMAPLGALQAACLRYGALLVVDEAHALGVLGPGGAGLCAAQGVEPTLRVGTLSKALGSQGAFVSGHSTWIQYLWNRARALIYSTALTPASLGAALAAIQILATAEGEALRAAVLARSSYVHGLLREAGVLATGSGSPLISLRFDHPGQASRIQEHLLEQGFLAWAFRPPTVPPETSVLRLSFSAAHSEAQVAQLVLALRCALEGASLLPDEENVRTTSP